MPVTAKLSRAFYERLGEDVANELVEWFNLVDQTYRNDLRAMNDMNFVRFDAKLEQRIAEMNARIDARFTVTDARIDQRFAEVQSAVDKRLTTQTRWLFSALAAHFLATITVLLRLLSR